MMAILPFTTPKSNAFGPKDTPIQYLTSHVASNDILPYFRSQLLFSMYIMQ